MVLRGQMSDALRVPASRVRLALVPTKWSYGHGCGRRSPCRPPRFRTQQPSRRRAWGRPTRTRSRPTPRRAVRVSVAHDLLLHFLCGQKTATPPPGLAISCKVRAAVAPQSCSLRNPPVSSSQPPAPPRLIVRHPGRLSHRGDRPTLCPPGFTFSPQPRSWDLL